MRFQSRNEKHRQRKIGATLGPEEEDNHQEAEHRDQNFCLVTELLGCLYFPLKVHSKKPLCTLARAELDVKWTFARASHDMLSLSATAQRTSYDGMHSTTMHSPICTAR